MAKHGCLVGPSRLWRGQAGLGSLLTLRGSVLQSGVHLLPTLAQIPFPIVVGLELEHTFLKVDCYTFIFQRTEYSPLSTGHGGFHGIPVRVRAAGLEGRLGPG